MSLINLEQGKWFLEEKTIYNGDVFQSLDDVFSLTAFSSSLQEVGKVYTDVDRLIFKTADADDYLEAIDNYLVLHFDTNRSDQVETPFIIKFDIRINADDNNKEGVFNCRFLESSTPNHDYTLKILDLKKDGFHRIYIENDNKSISYPLSFKWITLELMFFPKAQNLCDCTVKIDDYILRTIEWSDPQYYDINMFLCSINGNIDISNFSINRLVEDVNYDRLRFKITQTLEDNHVRLSIGKYIDTTDVKYYKFIFTKSYITSGDHNATLSNAVFENLIFKGRRTQNYTSNIKSVDIYFEDPNGNEIECTCSYLGSRWSDNGARDYAPCNFFATTQSESWANTSYSRNSYSEILSGAYGDLSFEVVFKTKIPLEYINNLTFNKGRGKSDSVNVSVYSSDDLETYTEVISKTVEYDNKYFFAI